MGNRLKTFDTDYFPVWQRLDAWRETMRHRYSDLGISIDDPTRFKAKLSWIKLGALRMSWLETTASEARVKRAPVGKFSGRISDAFLLVLPEDGELIGRQDGREQRIGKGDAMLVDAARPWEIHATGNSANITVKIPSERLMAIVSNPEQYCLQRFAHDAFNVRAVWLILQAVKAAIEAAPHEHWDNSYEVVVMAAVSKLFTTGQPMPVLAVRHESLKRKIVVHIERHMGDPGLASDTLAARFGISIRTVQRLFRETGQTPAQYIMERRLIRASERLLESPDARISEIAFAVGFNDLSHFTRGFGKRFGHSPSRFRNLRDGSRGEPLG